MRSPIQKLWADTGQPVSAVLQRADFTGIKLSWTPGGIYVRFQSEKKNEENKDLVKDIYNKQDIELDSQHLPLTCCLSRCINFLKVNNLSTNTVLLIIIQVLYQELAKWQALCLCALSFSLFHLVNSYSPPKIVCTRGLLGTGDTGMNETDTSLSCGSLPSRKEVSS